jgi:hypothetical protein
MAEEIGYITTTPPAPRFRRHSPKMAAASPTTSSAPVISPTSPGWPSTTPPQRSTPAMPGPIRSSSSCHRRRGRR